MSLLGQWTSSAAAAPARTRVPDGFGSVRTSPRLPAGFAKTFRSRFVQANGIRQQVVIGVKGAPLLLVHGWPEIWYAWAIPDAGPGQGLHRDRARPAPDRA